jgi:hypothetical protein
VKREPHGVKLLGYQDRRHLRDGALYGGHRCRDRDKEFGEEGGGWRRYVAAALGLRRERRAGARGGRVAGGLHCEWGEAVKFAIY